MARVVVVGAGGTLGSAVVRALGPAHEVIGATRSTEPPLDAADPQSIDRFFDSVGEVDAIVVCIGTTPFREFADLTEADYLAAFRGKTQPQLNLVVRAARHVSDNGSITLTSGVLARASIPTGAAAAAANGAIESFVTAAAPEMARGVRLNVVSPSVIAEATSYHSFFPGFVPVSAAAVARRYVESIEGTETGTVWEVE